jgi:hypothetical protein
MAVILGGGTNIQLASAYSAPVSPIVTSGLVFHVDAANPTSYPGTGTTWFDLTSNANNLVMSTTPPVYNAGNGGYFTFNGSTNEFIDGNNSSLWLTTGITIEAFVYGNSFTAQGNILDKNGNSGYRFRVNNSNRVEFIAQVAAKNYSTNATINTNQWYHLVVTHGTTGAIYINGVAQTISGSGNTSPLFITLANSNPLKVGRSAFTNEAFNGRIGLTRLYNRALTAAEVLQNFNADRARFGI